MTVRRPHMPPLRIHERRKHEGYVYVVQFCTGRIKIGQTTVPFARLRDHATAAETFGRTLTRAWLSKPHVNYAESEEILLDRARRIGGPSATGREYFDNVDFDEISHIASALWLCRWNDGYRDDPIWQRIVGERMYVRRPNESLNDWHERMAVLAVTAM